MGIDHVMILDSVPVGVALIPSVIENALLPKLVIKVNSLRQIYIGEVGFSREKSGRNVKY
jgi:hypothetical protein